MKIRVMSVDNKTNSRTVTVRGSDDRIYFVRETIEPETRAQDILVTRMGSPEEAIGRFSSKERGSRMNRTPITVALAKARIIEERWIK